MSGGTPKSLDEALALIFGSTKHSLAGVPFKDQAHAIMKDFLSQRFGVAMLTATDDERLVAVLEGLFNDITKRVY